METEQENKHPIISSCGCGTKIVGHKKKPKRAFRCDMCDEKIVQKMYLLDVFDFHWIEALKFCSKECLVYYFHAEDDEFENEDEEDLEKDTEK